MNFYDVSVHSILKDKLLEIHLVMLNDIHFKIGSNNKC